MRVRMPSPGGGDYANCWAARNPGREVITAGAEVDFAELIEFKRDTDELNRRLRSLRLVHTAFL